jgi:hypothetical protein
LGRLSEYISKKFGCKTEAVADPLNVTSVGTTTTQILPNNPDRLFYILVNLGSYDLYVAWDRSVGSTHGVQVSKGGGNLVLTADDDAELVGYEAYAVSPSGATDIYILTIVGV